MATRQQRATRNRRAGPAQPTLPFPVYRSNTGNKLTIGLYTTSQPPAAPITGYTLTPQGIPKVLREITGELPTAVEPGLLPFEFKLTYPGDPLEGGENFYLGPYDPALALPTGGHTSPGQVVIP